MTQPRRALPLPETLPARPGEDGVALGPLDSFIGMHLRQAYERAYADFETLLGPDSLRPGYYTMLTLILNNPGISQVEIGRAAGRDKSSVTKALRSMEDGGLITRTRVEDDRRSYASTITPAGRVLHARMERRAREHLANIHAALGTPERAADFLEMLRAVIAALPARHG